MSRIKLIVSLIWLSVCECKVAKYGHVQSPLYPEPYPVGLYMHWYLKVPHGYRIQLTFNHLDLEPSVNCSKDSLTVLHDREVLGKFCGRKSTFTHHTGNRPILSPGNHVCLVFETDESGPQLHHGFFVFYEAVEVDCGILELSDPDLVTLTEEDPLTTYNQNISLKCLSEFYQLVGHANFTCDGTGNWVSESGQNYSQNAPQCVPVCGRPTVDLNMRDRVLGGKAAPAGSFPWQVFLLAGSRSGAIVIGDRWLMTVAHNLEKINDVGNVKVFVGGVSVTELVKLPSLPIASLHVHPGYKNNEMRTNFDNDIALIKLNSSITFNENVMPLCLPAQDTELEHSGLVSGFGLTETFHKANQLRYIQLPVVDQDLCHTFVETERAIHRNVAPLTANMFCAGFPEGGKDTCSGDTGSAFVMKNNGMYWAAGIVSWGVECGKAGKYGIYTRVSKYADWIKKTMEENQ
ncbi:complement C1r subcomponent-like protein [Salminus brasiliensis]|uniref:complement C1r subcomponent-like protein n=1 Tax=Salminus brasiliensis TaxID=930266 RepID=UPI003B833FFE